jgi:drug/metabolite transporter (DMT)-like permease
MGLSAILLWSMTVGLVRSISEQIGPITAGTAVYLTGGLLSIGYYIFKKDGFRTFTQVSRIYLFGCGTLFILYSATLFLALGLAEDHYQTLELGLINYLWPALTILFSLFILSRKASFWLIPGTLLAIAGVYFVTSNNFSFSAHEFITHIGTNPLAYGLGFIAAVSWALYSNLARLASNNGSSGAVPLFMLITGIVLFAARYFYLENTSWSLQVTLEIAVLGVSSALAYVFWDAAMRKGEMILVVSFSYMTPFFSTVFSSVYLSVFPGSNLWLGCLLIILGSVISWKSIEKNKN